MSLYLLLMPGALEVPATSAFQARCGGMGKLASAHMFLYKRMDSVLTSSDIDHVFDAVPPDPTLVLELPATPAFQEGARYNIKTLYYFLYAPL